MAGKKKGVPWEEKRLRIMKIFYDRKEVFNLKEIAKLGPKVGVILGAIEDVVKSLLDDNLIDTDKIGAGNFLWALKSSAL
jgi:hypothetical protein